VGGRVSTRCHITLLVCCTALGDRGWSVWPAGFLQGRRRQVLLGGICRHLQPVGDTLGREVSAPGMGV